MTALWNNQHDNLVQNAVAEASVAHALNNVLLQTSLIQNPSMTEKFSFLPKAHQLHMR